MIKSYISYDAPAMLALKRPSLIPPWDNLFDRGIAYLKEHDALEKVRAAVLIGSVAEANAEPGALWFSRALISTLGRPSSRNPRPSP